MLRSASTTLPLLSQLTAVSSTALQLAACTAANAADVCSPSKGISPEQAARLDSGLHCSTSDRPRCTRSWRHGHQVRGYAKAAGGKGGSSKAAPAKPAVAAAAAPADVLEDFSPPRFRLKHVPRVYKGDPVAQLTGPQKALLEELSPGGGPLRSLRQLNWGLGAQETLALMHEQLSEVVGSNVQVVPFMLDDTFQSAAGLAAFVKETVENGQGMPRVEQAMLTRIANMAPSEVPFEGVKIQLKGRMSGKGGKASKKVWVWGRTGVKAHDDPVDYAHEAVVTRAGYIGIKVWVKYKRSHMVAQSYRIPQPAVRPSDLTALPALTALPSRSSSAWWNHPVTQQPSQHRAWEAFRQGYDPLTGTWQRQQQQQLPGAMEETAMVVQGRKSA